MEIENYFSLPLISKIKYWKDKYRDMPNGWAVSNLIGEQYMSEVSKISPQRRKKERHEKSI